jgi:L-rhamnose isomerase
MGNQNKTLMPILKIVFVGVSLLASLIAYIAGDYFGKKNCNKAIDAAVLTAQTDFQLQLEQANSQNQKVVIKTIKQNEKIKAVVSSYDVVQRVRLLTQIENFETRK